MCGINGIINYSSKLSSDYRIGLMHKMNEAISHRGPDSAGTWSDELITLGHTRLSIIDLSADANQPFIDHFGRYIIVYNGEIYNFKELRFELSRVPQGSARHPFVFRTNSDTEVILAAYLSYGSDCLNLFNGMFSFAIWDTQLKELFVARDRFGIKPFYYRFESGELVFSSEIRAILGSGLSTKQISKSAVFNYLKYQTVHAPSTIIEDINILMPGQFLKWNNGNIAITEWWNPVRNSGKINEGLDYSYIKQKIKNLFFSSVERRMISDVPVGAFLSGGIDSSAIVAAMAQQTIGAIDTFHVTFDNKSFSEAEYAGIIAKMYSTKHHEIKVSSKDILKDLPFIVDQMDFPGGDGINTYIVSREAKKQGVSVVLSGIGGDELFCGYKMFSRMNSLERNTWVNLLPRFSRVLGGEIYNGIKADAQSRKIKQLLSLPVLNFHYAYPITREVISSANARSILKGYSPELDPIYRILRMTERKENSFRLSDYSIAEIKTYLLNVLLRDADQMSMQHALEIRLPFLDVELVEYVLGLNDKYKMVNQPKKLLIDALGDLLPETIVNRPKMGFTFPWESWLKNDLREFCEEKLQYLRDVEIINFNQIVKLWTQFKKGDKTVGWSQIWHLVVLANWINKNGVR